MDVSSGEVIRSAHQAAVVALLASLLVLLVLLLVLLNQPHSGPSVNSDLFIERAPKLAQEGVVQTLRTQKERPSFDALCPVAGWTRFMRNPGFYC